MPHRRMARLLLPAACAVIIAAAQPLGLAGAWFDRIDIAPAAGSGKAGPQSPASGGAPKEPEADPSVRPKPAALSNRVTEYHIDVTLGEDGTLHGKQTVTWKNPGRRAVSDMVLHLHANAFQPGSTFLKESGGQLRGDRMAEGDSGSITITSLTTAQGESLLPRLHYIQPDDGNRADRTLAAFRLPEPVEPGKSFTMHMEFTVKLPRVFARMGVAGDFVMAGQWYPKIAVYETTGTRSGSEGWNMHQYHGNSEFYGDFGIYSVRINVPETHLVAATGFQTAPAKIKDGRKTYHFYAEDVHDFAWAASPHFVFAERSFSAPGVPGVRIKLYLDPLHKGLEERYMHAAASALALLGKWYGEYPYPTLTIVVPPADANGAGGMEYPTLVTAAAARTKSPDYGLERTLVHEIAHQYWYGMVATNEYEEPWLDEGFASYTEDKLMAAIYGILPNVKLEASYMTHPQPLRRFAWQYATPDGYAENVYTRAKLVLVAMERLIGEKQMNAVLRTYFQKYRFRHPTADDFRRVAETVTKRDWRAFFAAYVDRGEMADFAVDSAVSRPAEGGTYRTEIVLSRRGGVPQPVVVLLRFADDSSLRRTWDGAQQHAVLRVEHDAPLRYAVVDPAWQVVLDNRRYNNYLKAEVAEKTRLRWAAGLTQLAEALLAAVAW